MPNSVTCPYCSQQAPLVKGSVVYPHLPKLHRKIFFLCSPCRAWVGCHEGTTSPLGRLADAELRAAKSAAHAAFDPLWKSGQMNREEAYGWLAGELGIPRCECHIGMFDVTRCRATVRICNEERRLIHA